MSRVTLTVGLALGLGALAAPARAQIVNGDFETGSLAPWAVALTGNGSSPTQSVVPYDIDGPGPLGTTQVAKFQVGALLFIPPGGLEEGVIVTQSIPLTAGVQYTIDFDWAVQRDSTTNNADGGTFSIVVDGFPLAGAASGGTTGTTPIYGHLSAPFTPVASGPHTVGFQITRHFLVAGALYQYVDNFTVDGGAGCYPDCDGNGTLNVNDYICFQTKFALGDPYADCDNNGVRNVNDYICFQTKFALGC